MATLASRLIRLDQQLTGAEREAMLSGNCA